MPRADMAGGTFSFCHSTTVLVGQRRQFLRALQSLTLLLPRTGQFEVEVRWRLGLFPSGRVALQEEASPASR
jgi:hypothetical protein